MKKENKKRKKKKKGFWQTSSAWIKRLEAKKLRPDDMGNRSTCQVNVNHSCLILTSRLIFHSIKCVSKLLGRETFIFIDVMNDRYIYFSMRIIIITL